MAPRVPPRPEGDWDADTRAVLDQVGGMGDGPPLNIFATLAHHPKLLKRWLVFGNSLLFKGVVPARDRELVILRTGYVCAAEYEWGQHVVIARAAGVTDDEIVRVAAGPSSDWDRREAALLQMVDDLHADQEVSDGTWAALSGYYGTDQIIELIMTCGQYHLVAMALRSLGVELDDGVPGWAESGVNPPR